MIKRTLLLDSGAFSAWRQKKSIDIDDYIKYIRDNIEYIDNYVNLDVIPAEFGRKPTQAEAEQSALDSWNNMLYMEDFGLKPIPVFHMGEDFKWLQMMLDHGCPYIGISPANDRTTSAKTLWLDRVFKLLVNEKNEPIVKTHAFGVTAVSLMWRYPWFSVDSATWALHAAYGCVYIPKFSTDGTPRFDVSPESVVFSDEAKYSVGRNNFHTMTPRVRSLIIGYVQACNEVVEQVGVDPYVRQRLNIKFFNSVISAINHNAQSKSRKTVHTFFG